MAENKVVVIGGGLAGSEAAWQLAGRGIKVDLYEMRPQKQTGAHHTDKLSELVCSNSLGSYDSKNASALLKEEMKALNSLIVQTAWDCKVPAGGALAVDRESFSAKITEAIEKHPLINLVRTELSRIPDEEITIIATGPLTSEALSESIQKLTGEASLHFFDAASPILTRESINMDIAFEKSRYDKGEGSYINCPMNREQYEEFWHELVAGIRTERKDFEKDTPYFESCLPVEVIASRGIDTLRFGPMKPVGLEDPRTQKRAYAVVQLRQDNAAADLYNIVGFQTNLKWPEQKRIFSLIPGLESAEFVRLGVMHRNTYLKSPLLLTQNLNLKKNPRIFFAGQLTGVEGYSESCATGLIAAINASLLLEGKELLTLPGDTMIGALIRYITNADPKHFQPINSNWGIIDKAPELERERDKNKKREAIRLKALDSIKKIAEKNMAGTLALMTVLLLTVQVFTPALCEEYKAKVIYVKDGDSLTVLRNKSKEKVILYGIDCPELKQDFGQEAYKYTEQHINGKTVSVDEKGTDSYGRVVAEIFLPDGSSLNQELVKSGLAWWSDKYAAGDKTLKKYQENARSSKLGLWASKNPIPPWIYRNGEKKVQAVIKPGQ